jgi:hypothetical protein
MSDLRKAAEQMLECLLYHYNAGNSNTITGVRLKLDEKAIREARAALAAPEPVRHPGYVIGNHWLETAYERLCAGESEDAILEDYEVVREPRLRDLRRDGERIGWLERNGIGCEKVGNIGFFVWRNGTRYAGDTPRAAIDAAMEDKTCAAIDAAMQEDRS